MDTKARLQENPEDCSVGSSQTEVEWVGPLHDPLTLSQQWVDGNNFSSPCAGPMLCSVIKKQQRQRCLDLCVFDPAAGAAVRNHICNVADSWDTVYIHTCFSCLEFMLEGYLLTLDMFL